MTRNWRWTCSHCGAQGWEVISKQGAIPSHDRPDGRHCRVWPAWFTEDQKQRQLDHEAAGCPPPWPGAKWNGRNYV